MNLKGFFIFCQQMTGNRLLKVKGRRIGLPKNIDENDKLAKRDGIVFPDHFER